MIKAILWVVFFLALIALVPFLIGEKGYILIAMGEITIESTVVTALILLTLVFIALMLLLKVTKGSINISAGAWHKIAFAGRRRGQRNLNQGIAAFLLDDFSQAEHLLVKSAEPSKQAFLAYLTAAKAAHLQDKPANSDHYLQLVDSQNLSVKEASLESVLLHLSLLLARDELPKARTIIDEHHKFIGHDPRLLALEIDLCIKENRFESAIERLTAAAKQKTLAEKIPQWQKQAYQGYFNKLDNDALQQYWQKLAKKTKQAPQVMIAYCYQLAARNLTSTIEALLLPKVKKGRDTVIIEALKQLPLQSTAPFIQAIEKHLQKEPNNTLLLSALGYLAYLDNQLTLAEKAFFSLNTHVKPLAKNDTLIFAKVLIAQGKHQQANKLLLSHY